MQVTTFKTLPQFVDSPQSALASYHELGFHVEQNMFDSQECAALARASENLEEFRAGSLKPIYHAHKQDPIFMNAFRKPPLIRIMERLVSGRVHGIQTQFFHCPPGTPGFAAHQDNFYVRSKRDAFASAWTPLQDVNEEMGCLVVYPGSHREEILPTEEIVEKKSATQDINANRQQTVVPPVYKPLVVPIPQGSVLFIHGHLVHSSNDNRSKHFRRVFLMTYVREGETFREGNTARRTAVEMY